MYYNVLKRLPGLKSYDKEQQQLIQTKEREFTQYSRSKIKEKNRQNAEI